MKTHSNVLAWEIMNRGAWQATVHGASKRVSTTECAHTRVSFCFKRMHSAPCVQGQLCSDNNRPSDYALFMQKVASRHGVLHPAVHMGLGAPLHWSSTLFGRQPPGGLSCG